STHGSLSTHSARRFSSESASTVNRSTSIAPSADVISGSRHDSASIALYAIRRTPRSRPRYRRSASADPTRPRSSSAHRAAPADPPPRHAPGPGRARPSVASRTCTSSPSVLLPVEKSGGVEDQELDELLVSEAVKHGLDEPSHYASDPSLVAQRNPVGANSTRGRRWDGRLAATALASASDSWRLWNSLVPCGPAIHTLHGRSASPPSISANSASRSAPHCRTCSDTSIGDH